jgi:putative ABC transport system ATP-binding protein
MLKTDNLKFYYNKSQQSFSFPNINLKKQESLLILGKSGIGKTTLLHLMAGLLKPVEGSVFIKNTDINSLSNNKLDTFRGQHIGIVFQKKYALSSLKVIENLQARIYFSKKKIATSQINTLLDELEIIDFKNHKINELSEGQLQRLAIALSVIHNPTIILADEPTSSLDDKNCSIVIELLKKQAKKHKANLIIITHDQRVKPFFSNVITL